MDGPLLSVDRLCVAVNGRTLQPEISFAAHTGTVVRIVGRNGAGKTTLLRQSLGLHSSERDPEHAAVHMAPGLQVGYFPQMWGDTLLPWLDSWSNVLLGLASVPTERLPNHVVGLAAEFFAPDLPSLSHDPYALLRDVALVLCGRQVKTLSGGEQQKIALLRTFARGPRLLVLDEPFRDLDYRSTKVLTQYLQAAVSSRNVAVIYVSHQDVDLPPTLTVDLV